LTPSVQSAPVMIVIVPDGLESGDEFVVTAPDGQEFAVMVPDGITGNVAIEVDLPVAGEASGDAPLSTERVAVTIPDGVSPGDTFNVEATWGGLFEVVVPVGLSPGDTLEVELPAAPLSEAAEPAAATGTIPWGPTYAVGEKLKVQRTDGSWSPAEVVDHDETSDTYTVKLSATGQLKYMMSDSELQPLDYEAEACGDFFVGKRVQVPTIGAETRDEVMGEIRSFDAVNRTYDILMDTGLFKRGVQSEAIRVREKAKPPPAFRGPSLAMSRLGL